VERSDLAKRFFIARWERKRLRKREREAVLGSEVSHPPRGQKTLMTM
jgi:hypothetical protein